MRKLARILAVCLVAMGVTSAQDAGLHVIKTYKVGGEGGWDYLNIDANSRHLFISRGTHVIVLEAGLSYLGIGVPQPLASWGNIIQDGADQVATLWWMALFPGLFMVLTVMTLNILGEALRDAYERR